MENVGVEFEAGRIGDIGRGSSQWRPIFSRRSARRREQAVDKVWSGVSGLVVDNLHFGGRGRQAVARSRRINVRRSASGAGAHLVGSPGLAG